MNNYRVQEFEKCCEICKFSETMNDLNGRYWYCNLLGKKDEEKYNVGVEASGICDDFERYQRIKKVNK